MNSAYDVTNGRINRKIEDVELDPPSGMHCRTDLDRANRIQIELVNLSTSNDLASTYVSRAIKRGEDGA